MKKIGFIDLFIDEWHANNYPKWFRASAWGKDFTLALAWEENSKGGRPLRQWCSEMQISPADSLEQVVAECDALCVLAPSNPEAHERLAQLPLRSGKPVYIDKTFAPDKASAQRMFALADQHHTPLMSCSALRYGAELIQARQTTFAGQEVRYVATLGSGRSFEEYGIHQIEMIVSVLGTGARSVMQCGNSVTEHMVIEYGDDRRAAMTFDSRLPFSVAISGVKDLMAFATQSGYFPNLADAMLEFFATGKPAIAQEETIEITAIVAAGVKGLQDRGRWLEL